MAHDLDAGNIIRLNAASGPGLAGDRRGGALVEQHIERGVHSQRRPAMQAVKRFAAFGLAAACAACGTSTITTRDDSSLKKSVTTTDGPLRLEVTDFPTMGGVMWTLPAVTTSPAAIDVQSTRYGSLCIFDVSGRTVMRPGAIDLHVQFTERLTSCVAEIRALRYDATISAPAGSYLLTVIHDENGQADTLVHRSVTVP